LNNRQLHPDQITRIRQLNKNNSEREAQQLAVLCYLQKCDIAGMDGRLSGDAARLYQTGAQLLVADPQWFSQLQGEILADSALLRGNNSYGYLDKSADLVGSTHYKGMGPTYQNVLVQPAKDYVSEVAESSKNTVVSSAKTVYQKAIVENVPGLSGYEGAQADKAQSLLMQSRIEAGDAATINAGINQVANSTNQLLDGDAKAVGAALGNVALAVAPIAVSKGLGGLAGIQESNTLAAAEAKARAQTIIENNIYKEGSAANPDKALSPGFGSTNGIELTGAQASQMVRNGLPANITVVGTESADALNAAVLAGKEGYKPPYIAGSEAITFRTQTPTQFVRVYTAEQGGSGQVSSWMLNAADIKGLSVEQIASKYSLPQVPNMIADVNVPAGQMIRTSAASDVQIKQGVAGNGGGSGVQFEVLVPEGAKIPPTWFSNPRSLP